MRRPDHFIACRGPNNTGWQDRHVLAVRNPARHERGIVAILNSWVLYAETHESLFKDKIGNDSILGKAWMEIGKSLRALLNGELGRLDGGTMDGWIIKTAEYHGIDPDEL